MIDPRREAVLIRSSETQPFEDKTSDVARYEVRAASGRIEVAFNGGNRGYLFGLKRVLILGSPRPVALADSARIEVNGHIWEGATRILHFAAPEGGWYRIFYKRVTGEAYRTFPDSNIRIVASATRNPAAADVLSYWRAIVARLPADDPLRPTYDRLRFVHPESVLASFLTGAPIESRPLAAAPIFPFRCNLSQREAVENALTHSISVIEGPPGTGKTETILNLIANLVAVHGKTVGVVSFGNTAVDKVRDKLRELGFGQVIANLGRRDKRRRFFADQTTRNAEVDQLVDHTPDPPSPEQLAQVDQRLHRLQDAERARAERRQALDAHRLELRHFEQHLQRDEVPELSGLPLLRRSADRILDYLAESENEYVAGAGFLRRIRNYFKYGSLRGLDPRDTGVVLRLQRAYYDRRIAELEEEIGQVEHELRRADFDQLTQAHQQLSAHVLHAQLAARYRGLPRTTYTEETYRLGNTFAKFVEDYPVLLSTCHSLRASIADEHLLDYLIIDEASQVNLLQAGLALSCCRNLVVVGDQQQLAPIPPGAATDLDPPRPAYDCRQHSLLSSLARLYGDDLPRTLLREHYRCDPAIIGFCNKKFYDGELIPYTTSGAERPMIVARTAEGNHMRQHRGGGRSNQREVDVIASEVIPDHCRGIAGEDIGVTTPYRLQADKAGDVLDQVQADTVHKFQGRQKKVVILTTVLDETWRGKTGLAFVDDPKMINVAVSRAVQRFILVTNHDMLPTSRHIRDLVGYIRYHNPGEEVADSAVISMFDLLYSAYSERLRPLAARLKQEMKYPSEDIIWTALHDILAERPYAHLKVRPQVLLRHLLSGLSRLTPEQKDYIDNRASVDFVVYNRVTNQTLLAIEVDGFAFHENNPGQLKRDAIKNEILRVHQMPLLRLPTTGSEEERRIRHALDKAEAHWAQLSDR